MVVVFGGWCDEAMTRHQFHLINSLVTTTLLWYLWPILKAGTVIAGDLTFSMQCQHLAKVNSCQVNVHVRAHSVWASAHNWSLPPFGPLFICFLPPKHNTGVWQQVYYLSPIIIPSSVKLQTHSLPHPSSYPSRYQNIQSSCPWRTTAVLSSKESWLNTSTTFSVTSC